MTLFLHQMHRGQQLCLASRNSLLCLFRITKLFFSRWGLHMGADQNDESFISFRLWRQSARLLPVRNSILSLSQATGDSCVPFAVIQFPRRQTRRRKWQVSQQPSKLAPPHTKSHKQTAGTRRTSCYVTKRTRWPTNAKWSWKCPHFYYLRQFILYLFIPSYILGRSRCILILYHAVFIVFISNFLSVNCHSEVLTLLLTILSNYTSLPILALSIFILISSNYFPTRFQTSGSTTNFNVTSLQPSHLQRCPPPPLVALQNSIWR